MNKLYLFTILLIIFLISNSSAQKIIGVSPADIYLKNVLRGGYSERYATISLTSDEKVSMEIEPRGDIATWLNFSETKYLVSTKTPWRLLISVSPPVDIPNGNYTGFLRISSQALDQQNRDGHAVGTILAVVDLAINVEIVDREAFACTANNFYVTSVEKGDNLVFSVDVMNGGNIRIRPKLSTNIWNAEQTGIVKSFNYTGNEILPTKQGKVEFKVPTSDLEVGQYWVDFLASDCFASSILTFDVLEEGALRADGVISSIFTKTWANIDETVPIFIVFKNIGEKEVDSEFRGKIVYGDKIVSVLQSPKTNVLPSEENNFTFYFTPKSAGKYVVSGRVFYDKKRTFESSTVINVKPNNLTLRTLIIYALYLILAVVIFIILYKIRSEKNRYLDRLRRFKHYG